MTSPFDRRGARPIITDEQVERAFQTFVASCNEMAPCPRCEGRGYHHGFGENGHDPDWCEQCDGSQFVAARDDRESMRLALTAAITSCCTH